MKKEVLIGILIFSLIFSFPILLAEDENSSSSLLSVEDKAYECLEEKVGDCSALTSLEDKIFSLIAIKQCGDDVLDASQGEGQCWPSTNCDLETTAKSVLALDNSNRDTTDAEEWLKAQSKTSVDLVWYLQIESSNPTTCSISYEGAAGSISTTISFGEDKSITSVSGGNCFTSYVGDYWPRINTACYDKEFAVSCNESFLTTLLYQKNVLNSPIYVSGTTSSSSAGGQTTEKPNSFCFKKGSVCDYEGSLWAALALDSLGNDMTAYLPYLITVKEDHKNSLPDSFLWHLTGDSSFYNDLINQQSNIGGNRYWQKSSQGKFYDTALALYSLRYDESSEKLSTLDWLTTSQEESGCWNNGNIRDTAFLLHSVWPRAVPGGLDLGGGGDDCELAGFSCSSSYSCVMEASGSILNDYDCGAGFVCCSSDITFDTCSVQGGQVCFEGETCSVEGTTAVASDTEPGQECCVGGICEVPAVNQYDCEPNGGVCKMYGCEDGEEESTSYVCAYGDSCCFESTSYDDEPDGEKKSSVWIWVLLILIVLVVLGIMFKDQLRRFLFRAKSGGNKRRGPPGPGFPRPASVTGRPGRPGRPGPSGPRPGRRPKGEIDDVLKKLKQMGS